jgi:hypothetical protein
VYADAALTPYKTMLSDKLAAERGFIIFIITIDRQAHLQNILAF